jgi:hypothetical protein
MKRPMAPSVFYFSCVVCSLPMIFGCTSHGVKLVQPQNGATAECSSSGFGIGTVFAEGFVGECIRRYESKGYVRLDQLAPEQRADLERRGLLH